MPASNSQSRPLVVAAMLNTNSGERAAAEFVKHELELNLGRDMVFDLFPVPGKPPVIDDAKDFVALTKPDLLIVAGGDGTISLALDITDALRREERIGSSVAPVAILPMGTGNDLSRTLGFGGGYTKPLVDPSAKFKELLEKMYTATPQLVDRWQLTLTVTPPTKAAAPEVASAEPDEPDTVMSSVMVQRRRDSTVTKGFINYFSAGFDAEIAANFGEFRHKNPKLCESRVMNKMWYGAYGLKALTESQPFPKDRIKVTIDGAEVNIPKECKSIIVSNVITYSGGVVLWHSRAEPASVDDGMLEVTCLEGVWHMVGAGTGATGGKKLGQGANLRIVVPAHFIMQYDGEPMEQAGGEDQDAIVTITHAGRSLATTLAEDKAEHRTTVAENKAVYGEEL